MIAELVDAGCQTTFDNGSSYFLGFVARTGGGEYDPGERCGIGSHVVSVGKAGFGAVGGYLNR